MKFLRPAAVLIIALILAFAARRWVVSTVRVTGTSMQDTLAGGDVVTVTHFDYLRTSPRRGDVVQCRFPGRGDTYIKRVIGLPGDDVSFRGGTLTVNGRTIAEPYVSTPTDDYEIMLGEDEYLVLGDNRAESYDSRMEDMGPVGADAFLGRVRWVIWPPDRTGAVR